jgi:DNA-binding XRE family transcriptional regulator
MNVGIPNLQARKLTKIQIKEIRENKNNLTERKLAKKYKISRTTIWKIKQNWVYVEI